MVYNNKKLCKEDQELIQRLCNERNLKEGAVRRMITPVKQYLQFHKDKYTMTQLIQEANKEQEQGVPPQKTRLYQYLTDFRLYLNNNVSPRTLKNYMIKIREIYRHYNITVPELKPFKTKEPPQVTYDDIPTRDEIRQAVEHSPIDMKALILFQSSSGTTLHESMTITVDMFLQACKEYITWNSTSISYNLSKIRKIEQLVPTFYLERVKTNKYYYTCCSPEASQCIIEYLLYRVNHEELSLDSLVFPLTKHSYTKRYHDLNKKLGLGTVGFYAKFRSHALRKYHASNIGCGTELIDELQGRGKSTVHEAYIKDRPEKIKKEYLKYMHNVMLYSDDDPPCDVEDNDTSDVVTPQNKEPVPQVHHDVTNNDMVYKLIKEVAVLEQRIEYLEQKLGGV